MQRTPLYEAHRSGHARLIEFAGWEMPVSYSGVIDEHQTVRTSAGLFDVSHMGRIAVEGPGAESLLQHVVTRNLEGMRDGRARYALVCNHQGGILDDVVVFRRSKEQFFVVVNASNRAKVLQWIEQEAAKASGAESVQVWDLTEAIAMIAVQGPMALGLLDSLTVFPHGSLASVARWALTPATVSGIELLLATTGYTGEAGAELFVESGQAAALWEALLLAGKTMGVKPIGLGARDTLRLEMGYSLYGHEIDESISPLEAGLDWAVDLDGPPFIGQGALRTQRLSGLKRRLAAFALPDRAVPRQGYRIFHGEEPVGLVTSGNLSPMAQKGVGLGFLPPDFTPVGTEVGIEIRKKIHQAMIVPLPFYRVTTGASS